MKEFTSLNGYMVKDSEARKNIEINEANTNSQMVALNKRLDNLTLTSVVVSSTLDMTDTSKIYINTSDNNWYYYDPEQLTFVVGGQFIFNMDSAISYDKLDGTINKYLLPYINIAWEYDDVTNLTKLYSNRYYYGGYFINNTDIELNVKIIKLDTRTLVSSEEVEVVLGSGEKYVLEDECYYNVEITKASGEVFELVESVQLSQKFNFISNLFQIGNISTLLDDINGEVV